METIKNSFKMSVNELQATFHKTTKEETNGEHCTDTARLQAVLLSNVPLGSTGSKVIEAAHLFELRLRVDVHVADLAVEGFVLEARRRIGRRGQLGLDSAPREGLDGSVAAARLQHRLVFGACRREKNSLTVSRSGRMERCEEARRRPLTSPLL